MDGIMKNIFFQNLVGFNHIFMFEKKIPTFGKLYEFFFALIDNY